MDIARLIALPIIIYYPYFFVIMYAVYVALDTLIYLRMREKTPYWIVLIYPFFGVFGLITRACGFAVFLYRRIVVLLKKAEQLDHYREAPHWIKVCATIIPALVFLSLLISSLVIRFYNF